MKKIIATLIALFICLPTFAGQIGTVDYKKVIENYSKAKECFEKHLEFYPNDDNSLCELGELYVNGYGIEQDYQEAYKWFMKSYEKENGSAACELSKMYFNF